MAIWQGDEVIGMDSQTKNKISNEGQRIGLIAGGGQFPMLFAQRAAEKGYAVYAVAYANEADTALECHVNTLTWLHLGQVGKLIKFFKQYDVDTVVMLGSVKKTRIFKDIKPDLKAISFIASKGGTHDDGVLRSFADLLEGEGISVLPSTTLLPELLSPKGCWTKRRPDKAELRDIEMGWRIAGEIGRLDIGQCVVVGNGTVLAVEGADGTDATIRRGGSLYQTAVDGKSKLRKGIFGSGGGVVVVKRSKPQQDLRFDLPASGSDTIRTMIDANGSVLVLEAGKTLSFDRQEMIELADGHGISIVAMDDEFKNEFK